MLKILLVLQFVFLTIIGGTQVVSIDSVSGYLGKKVTVFGEVDDGRYLPNATNQPTLLNMGGKFPNQKLTVVIYGNSRANFGYKPEEMLLKKRIYVTGKVELYKGQPQILIDNPFDIAFTAPVASSSVSQVKANVPEKTSGKAPKTNNREVAVTEKPVRNAAPKEERAAARSSQNVQKPVVEKPVLQKPAQPVIVLQTPTPKIDGEIVINSNLSLKAGPGPKFNTVGSIKKGTRVTVISSSYGWSKVAEVNGGAANSTLTGYVKTDKLD